MVYDDYPTDKAKDAAYLKSREARVIGQGQPPSDSIASDAERLASRNEGATKTSTPKGPSDPVSQSAADRAANFEKEAENIVTKMATNPQSVTKEEADLTHSREQRAFGQTSKGGVASQAQSLANDNMKNPSATQSRARPRRLAGAGHRHRHRPDHRQARQRTRDYHQGRW